MNNFKKLVLIVLMSLCGSTSAFAFNLDNLRNYFLNANYKACISEGESILAQATSSQGLDELYYILGLSYLKDGNYLRSSDIFEIVLKEYRNSKFREEAKLGLADSYFMKGDLRKAENIYQEMLKDNSRSKLKPAIYYRLSQLAKKTYDLQKEQLYLAKLKSEFPQSPEALIDKEFLPGARQVYVPVIEPTPISTSKPVILDKINVPAVQPTAPTKDIISGAYSVQVGAFTSPENARKLTLKLKAQGYSSYISRVESMNKSIYKVRVGGFESLQEAKGAEKALKVHGYPTKIIF